MDYSKAHSLDNAELAKFYEAAGFRGRVGWGERPAILVIDMAGAWTNPDEQIGSDLSEVEDNIVKILAEGRRAGLPIIFTTMAWDPSHSEIGEVVKRKTTHSLKMLHGTDRVACDRRWSVARTNRWSSNRAPPPSTAPTSTAC